MEHFNKAYQQLAVDHRITVWHISLYIALLHKWYENNSKNPIQITRREIMEIAHIGSIATYHKCIRQLHEFGFIEYLPSFDPSLGSRIYLR